MGSAFTVADNLTGQGGAGLAHELVELVLVGLHAGGSGGEQQHCVIGGHATIHVDTVERMLGGHGKRGLHLTGTDHSIGSDDAQHGGQLRGDHARPLDHAADLPAVGTGQFDRLRLGIRGHDGVGCISSGLGSAGIGTAGVENHGFGVAVRHGFAAPLHRGCTESVRREHAGHRVKRAVVDHESEILLAFNR